MENGVPMADAAATRTAAERAAFVVVVLAVCLNARRVFCPTNAELVVVVVVARDAIIIIIIIICVSVGIGSIFVSVHSKCLLFRNLKKRRKNEGKNGALSFDPSKNHS